MDVTQLKAMLASYGRSVLGAGVALYMAGVPTEDLLYSLVAAIAPVALRAINPNDKAFGKMPAEEEIATALTAVKVVKAPVKKAAAKKAPAKKTTK
jgi:hypothetical protein